MPEATVTAPEAKLRDSDRRTRKPLALWDRVKYLLLLVIIWFVLVWASMAGNPLLPFTDAMREAWRADIWVVALAGIEVVRQLHFIVTEHWAGYHRFWSYHVFGGSERAAQRGLSDWTRFRMARAGKFLFWVAILALVLGRIHHENPVLALFGVPAAFIKALPLLLQVALFMLIAIGQFAALFWFLSKGGVDVYFPDDISTRFSDVWGQDHVLERVKENMLFLENPEAIEAKGGYVPGGILLYGPPGTGKTLMAEAVAGETGKPYVFVDPGAFTNMFMGVGILKVKSLFRKLRRLALRYGGVIVFFDEADSLGNRGAAAGGAAGMLGMGQAPPSDLCNGTRYVSAATQQALFVASMTPPPAEPPRRHRQAMGGMMGGNMMGMGTLQALLTELSGLKKPRGMFNRIIRRALGMRPKPPPKYRILVMMATNMPDALDPALLRPGRIDRVYRVGYPSKEGRKRTYDGYLSKVKHTITPEQVEHLAVITPYSTGATIKDLVNEALVVALREDRDTITYTDLLTAKLLKSVGPAEGVEYVHKERHAVAVHEACHAVTSYYLQKQNVIDTATIQKGEGYLGFVAPIPIEERFTSWSNEYEADIMVSVASLVGERMFFDGDSSSGVSGDLQNATTLALAMEGLWGMGEGYGVYSVTKAGPHAAPVADGTDRNMLESEMGRRVEARLSRLADRATTLLTERRIEVLAVAHALESRKTISGEDVIAIIEGDQGPMVDGRMYHSPTFAAQLEAYHAQALAVHQGREHVMALPTLPGASGSSMEPEAISAATPQPGVG